MHIWTINEIRNLPSILDTKVGWFYGFIRNDDGKLYFSEIYPGLGFALPNKGRVVISPWWHPKSWYYAIKDAIRYKPNK